MEKKVQTCASCGEEITDKCIKVKNPLEYKKGKNKGKVKPCCKNPDWRVCPNTDCENVDEYDSPALICKNCGYYYGMMTW